MLPGMRRVHPIEVSDSGIITSGLQLYLDVGDSGSYDGSSQTWTDISGNARDFYRGRTSATTTDDPTFNGSAGDKSTSTYFSYDGGDCHQIVTSASSGDFFRTVGRSDSEWTFIFGIYFGSTSANQVLFTNGSSTNKMQIWFGHNVDARFGVSYASDTFASTSNTNLSTGTWYHVAILGKLDGSTTCKFFVNNSAHGTFTATNSWSSGDSDSGNTQLGGRISDTLIRISSGSRIQFVRIYNRALSDSEVSQDYNACASRLGL